MCKSVNTLFLASFMMYGALAHATTYCPDLPKRIIFVNNTCTGPGDGSFETPYTDLSTAIMMSSSCDVIYVFPGDSDPNNPMTGYNAGAGGFQLLDYQRLLGTSTEAFEFCPGCPLPVLRATGSRFVVGLKNNNQVSGFIIQTDANVNSPSGIAGGTGSFGSGQMITNGIFTNNIITCTSQGACISLDTNNNVGTITIANSTFKGADNDTFTSGNFISDYGNGTFSITNNLYTGIDNNTGLNIGILVQAGSTPGNSFSILNNNFNSMNNIVAAGLSMIAISMDNSFFPAGSFTANISNNTIVMPNIGSMGAQTSPIAGIFISASINNDLITHSGQTCVALLNNKVITPPGCPGYLLSNTNYDGAFLFYDESNLGSIETNSLYGIEITQPPFNFPPIFPITYSDQCGPQ